MKVSEESFFITSSASESDKIFFKKLFRGEKEREKAILFFHDSRLHGDVFNDFFQNILQESKNIEVYSFDLYGHGRSGGERMGPVSPSSLILDVENIVNKITEIADLPIYFVGVGFGASLILNYLSEYEKNIVKGIALLNPMLEIKLNFSNIEKLLSFDFTYGSSLRISSKQNVSDLIFDSQKKVDLSQDPLCFNYYTRGFLKTMRCMGKGARTKAYFVDQPSYIIFTEESPLYGNDIIPIFAKGLRSKNVEIEKVIGSHLFMLEDKRVSKSLIRWMNEN